MRRPGHTAPRRPSPVTASAFPECSPYRHVPHDNSNSPIPGGYVKSLETVLALRTFELVELVAHGAGLTEERAERFVALAGSDLLASFRWQARDLALRSLGTPSTARDVLSTMRADRIASQLGMSSSDVWVGLRELVPHVLSMAEDPRAA